MAKSTEQLLIACLTDLLAADAAHSEALRIHKDDPMHPDRVHAEMRWAYVIGVATMLLNGVKH